MTRPLIAASTSKNGRFSGKVYRVPESAMYQIIFYVEGVPQRYADMEADSEPEALEKMAWSLCTADEMQAGIEARRAAEALQ